MSKSILVVGTPENCHYCQFCTMEGYYCEAISGNICRGEAERRPHWCPLIDMPEEISIEYLEEALKRDKKLEEKMAGTRMCKGKYQISGKPGCFEEFEIGKFHQWGSNYEEFESGAGNYSVAIVELPDGKIVMPMANDICFLEDEAISKLIEKCANKKESPYTPEGAKSILNLYRDHVCIMMLQQKEAEKTETLYNLFNALKMGEYALTQLMEQGGNKGE